MKVSEAIEEFNILLSVPSEMLLKYDYNVEQVEALKRVQEAEKMAIQALKKQVPKKPILIEDRMYKCCGCTNNLMFKYSRYPDILMPKEAGGEYCMVCGQKIDWGDLE